MTTQFSVRDAHGSEHIGSLEELRSHLRATANKDYANAVLRWAQDFNSPEFKIRNGVETETWCRS